MKSLAQTLEEHLLESAINYFENKYKVDETILTHINNEAENLDRHLLMDLINHFTFVIAEDEMIFNEEFNDLIDEFDTDDPEVFEKIEEYFASDHVVEELYTDPEELKECLIDFVCDC